MIVPAWSLACEAPPRVPRTLGLAGMGPVVVPVGFRGLDIVDPRVALAPLGRGPAAWLAASRLPFQAPLTSSGSVGDTVSGLDRRAREMAWRRANAEELRRRFLGQWIVLEGTEIIANGPDPVAIVQVARRRGIHSPYVFRVEGEKAPKTSSLGL